MIIENSASFQGKTEYSQEKYVKKKKEKYLAQYAVIKPSIRNLCAYYVQGHNKKKILNMRMDTIAQILTYANIAAHRNVMVVDSCKGLLLAAVLDRVGGFGNVVNFSANGSHIACRETLDFMNFPVGHLDNVYNFPLEKCHKSQVNSVEKKDPY
jgi:tRNA (adenine-N(1)-)-methyltransferase non-catalytic subunit